MAHDYYVYILTDKGRKTLYIGVTNDLAKRLWEHRNPEAKSFSQQYHCILLMHYEQYSDIHAAIAREKQLKGWRRAKKVALIEKENPRWEDLSVDWEVGGSELGGRILEILRQAQDDIFFGGGCAAVRPLTLRNNPSSRDPR